MISILFLVSRTELYVNYESKLVLFICTHYIFDHDKDGQNWEKKLKMENGRED